VCAHVGDGMRMSKCVRVCVCVGGCECTSAGVFLLACRLIYLVCHVEAPYCLHPLCLRHIFRHYPINDTISETSP
jgi:hypothetical protein